jgi:hypothetical protein
LQGLTDWLRLFQIIKNDRKKSSQMGFGMGRPPKYKTPEEMQVKIDEFFNNPPDTRPIYNKDGDLVGYKPLYTITGLVLYLGFCDRHSFYAYGNKEEFSHTIKSARTKMEKVYEILLQDGLGAGAIFALKNFGWKDSQEDTNTDDRLAEKLKFETSSNKKTFKNRVEAWN